MDMTSKTSLMAAASLCAAALPGCSSADGAASAKAPMIGMANPASVWCVRNRRGRLEIRKDKDGGEYGVCILPDSTEVEEWELFRRDHRDGGGKS